MSLDIVGLESYRSILTTCLVAGLGRCIGYQPTSCPRTDPFPCIRRQRPLAVSPTRCGCYPTVGFRVVAMPSSALLRPLRSILADSSTGPAPGGFPPGALRLGIPHRSSRRGQPGYVWLSARARGAMGPSWTPRSPANGRSLPHRRRTSLLHPAGVAHREVAPPSAIAPRTQPVTPAYCLRGSWRRPLLRLPRR